MKKLKLTNKAIELLEKNEFGAMYLNEYEITYTNLFTSEIAKFRFFLHKLVELDIENEKQKKLLNEKISSNDFTAMIMLEYIELF